MVTGGRGDRSVCVANNVGVGCPLVHVCVITPPPGVVDSLASNPITVEIETKLNVKREHVIDNYVEVSVFCVYSCTSTFTYTP